MLPTLNQPKSRATRRTLLFLGIVAVAALTLPTIRWATHAESAGLAGAAADDAALRKDSGKAAVDRRETPVIQMKARDAAVDAEYLPRPSKFEEKVLAALEKPIDVEFRDLSLEDCIQHLQEASKIPMWVDKPALAAEQIALGTPVTLKLQGGRLESVLNLILNPAKLTYLLENDVLVITTTGVEGEKLITRTYPVRDLCQSRGDSDVSGPDRKNEKAAVGAAPGGGLFSIESRPVNERPQVIGVSRQPDATMVAGEIDIQVAQGFGPGGGGRGGGGTGGAGAGGGGRKDEFTSLMNLISTTVEPDSWEDLSGPGSMMPHRGTLSLVIRQTWAVHRQILQLFRDLRDVKRMEGAAVAGVASNADPVPPRHQTERYSVVGVLDLDGDGQEDSDLVRWLLTTPGCDIHKIDANGILRVLGRSGDDGRPSISDRTKFVVVGTTPEITADTAPGEATRIRKMVEVRRELEVQARKQGTRVVSLRDFLNYLGYKSKADRTNEAVDAPYKLKDEVP